MNGDINALTENLTDPTFLQKQYAGFATSELLLYMGKNEAASHGESPEFKENMDNLMANNDNIVKNIRFILFVQELAFVDFVAWNNRCLLEVVQNLVAHKENRM